MNKTLTVLLFWLLSSSHLFSQVKFPYPINTDSYEEGASFLPDSSIILMSNRLSTYKCYRFIFNGDKWQLESNSLSTKINSLILTKKSSVLNMSFSNDFTHVVITVRQFDKFWIYESNNVNNEWSLFKQILTETNNPAYNYAFSYGNTNDLIYSRAYSSKNNTPNILVNRRAQTGWVATDTIDVERYNIDFSAEVISIGNGLLVHASWKPNKRFKWVFSKKLDNGEWTVPSRVNNILGSQMSLAPSGDFFLTRIKGDIYSFHTPTFLKDEIAKSRSAAKAEIEPPKSLISSTPTKSKFVKPTGNYYALLIGNSDYDLDELDLDRPTKDVNQLANVLTTQYQFDDDKVIKLVDSGRNSTLQALYNLRKTLTPDDNLLIFYAGHGYWDEQIGQGYWWPTDAIKDNPSNWLSNSDLREQIRGINTAHTLLISDACFSGGIFKTRGAGDIRKATRDIQLLYRMPSRRAITSGTLSTVPDNSVFFKYLIKYLTENDKKFISSSDLFTTIRTSVLNNSLTVPQDGVILNTGDEGGDFIFIKK